MNAPIVTPKLVNNVFCLYQPAPTGLEFGQGLSPFAIVCQGHSGVKEVEMMVRDASLVESGTSTSLADTRSLISTDVRFPKDAVMAADKLTGWSIFLDLFHGSTHPIAEAVQRAVSEITPGLHRTYRNEI